MSMSSELREFGKLSGRRVPQEKSTFSQTCNLLSQYLKENKSLGDLSFATTLNRDSEQSPAMDLFPQHAGFGDSASKEEAKKITQPSEIMQPNKPTPKQMTIIYGGKVIILDDIAEEKARELMMLASSSTLQNNLTNLDGIPPHVSGLPIARKASLHRFLAKRKDRINARAPYQLNMSVGSSTASEEKKTWLGLA